MASRPTSTTPCPAGVLSPATYRHNTVPHASAPSPNFLQFSFFTFLFFLLSIHPLLVLITIPSTMWIGSSHLVPYESPLCTHRTATHPQPRQELHTLYSAIIVTQQAVTRGRPSAVLPPTSRSALSHLLASATFNYQCSTYKKVLRLASCNSHCHFAWPTMIAAVSVALHHQAAPSNS